jgi:hypothetical protein
MYQEAIKEGVAEVSRTSGIFEERKERETGDEMGMAEEVSDLHGGGVSGRPSTGWRVRFEVIS